MIGLGVIALGVLLSTRLSRLGVYTVSEMLEKRYGAASRLISAIIVAAYALMIAVTSTIAIGSVFDVVLGLPPTVAILIAGGIVVAYSVAGGMWSITLTDFLQFLHHDRWHLLRPAAALASPRPAASPGCRKRCRHPTSTSRPSAADDLHLLLAVLFRAHDRAGHLAAGLHGAQPRDRPLGRRRRRGLLPALRSRRRAGRDGGQGAHTRPLDTGQRLRPRRERGPARRASSAWCWPPRSPP